MAGSSWYANRVRSENHCATSFQLRVESIHFSVIVCSGMKTIFFSTFRKDSDRPERNTSRWFVVSILNVTIPIVSDFRIFTDASSPLYLIGIVAGWLNVQDALRIGTSVAKTQG